MLFRQRWHLELRHLRYFVAVAEARSLKLAAEEKLHTTQPSLSRQIRDLEDEVGTPLFVRGAKGVELTPAGRVFLDHARIMLSQAEAAVQSARQIAYPTKPSFALGFMIGHDTTWLPEALKLLRDELPNIHVVISTQNSPQLAAALLHGGIDVAFLRREDGSSDLDFRTLVEEPFEVFMPSNHPFAARKTISLQEIAGETFISVSGTALSISGKQPALRRAIDRFLNDNGIEIRPSHEVDNLGGVMSLIASTGGIALLPLYAKTFLPDTVTTRPLEGVGPKIDLSVGYRKANPSPVLKLFLSRVNELAAKIPR
ncbi:LysR family transcriptional regulator [Granulicella mallensis]|uniref:Transcriptional regulator, LysR family n=1 Tax=Granulicella mallensis (strain ATCC BAA-1857 / DSM 23137 / MP5ACTX8) TaxID=682795 RepID=G8NYR6_GRAMM|nr:LysR family transcriptional regulator [Granulicella mallensis]AEU34479.1 transcriptional regulator, LysR family [Granulicella mallensis MP5ACTX8]